MRLFRFYTNEYMKDQALPPWPLQDCTIEHFEATMLLNHLNPSERSQATLRVLLEATAFCTDILREITSEPF